MLWGGKTTDYHKYEVEKWKEYIHRHRKDGHPMPAWLRGREDFIRCDFWPPSAVGEHSPGTMRTSKMLYTYDKEMTILE